MTVRRRMLTVLLTLAVVAAMMIAAACEKRGNNNQRNPMTPDVTYRISIVSGNNQSGRLDNQLPNPLRVYVTDDALVKQVYVKVNFKIVEGTAELSAPSQVTDVDGYCEVFLTPTSAPGDIKVEAEVSGTDTAVIFNATGTQ